MCFSHLIFANQKGKSKQSHKEGGAPTEGSGRTGLSVISGVDDRI